MKTWKKVSLAVALITAVGLGASAVQARGGFCDGGPWDGRGGPGAFNRTPEQVKDRVQTRLARLELALAIKPEQKGAWDQFSRTAETRAEKMVQHMTEMQKAGIPKTALERLDRMEKMAQVHQGMLTETRTSVEALYGALNDAQRKVFDAEWMDGGFGPGFLGHLGRAGDGRGRDGRGRGAGPGSAV